MLEKTVFSKVGTLGQPGENGLSVIPRSSKRVGPIGGNRGSTASFSPGLPPRGGFLQEFPPEFPPSHSITA
jgi:hypothetical protein